MNRLRLTCPTKTCGKCKRELPIECFGVHRASADGRRGICKYCRNDQAMAYAREHKTNIKAYTMHYKRKPKDKKDGDWYKKRKRRHITKAAVRNGLIVKPDGCQVCGTKDKIEIHHDDYDKPMSVRWLCRECHCRHHFLVERMIAEGELRNLQQRERPFYGAD